MSNANKESDQDASYFADLQPKSATHPKTDRVHHQIVRDSYQQEQYPLSSRTVQQFTLGDGQSMNNRSKRGSDPGNSEDFKQ